MRLRWREAAPWGSIRAYEAGDAGELGALIRIEYRGRHENGGWYARQRAEPDCMFPDGWMWADVLISDQDALGGYASAHAWTGKDIRALVTARWEEIRRGALALIAEAGPGADGASGAQAGQSSR